LLQRSEEFDNASWVKNATGINTAVGTNGIEPNVAVAPDGITTADRINFLNQGNPDLGITQVVSIAPSQTYTTSIWLKGEGSDIGKQVRFRPKRATAGALVVNEVLVTLESEWVRVAVTLTMGADNVDLGFFISSNVGGATTCLIWGAQLELGSFASTYIPTTDTALTRNADVLTVTGLQDIFSGQKFAAYAEFIYDTVPDRSNGAGLYINRGVQQRGIVMSAGSNGDIVVSSRNDTGETVSSVVAYNEGELAKYYAEFDKGDGFDTTSVNGIKPIVNGVVYTLRNLRVDSYDSIIIGRSSTGGSGALGYMWSSNQFRIALWKQEDMITEQQAIELTTI
jgi:hypothetical protein